MVMRNGNTLIFLCIRKINIRVDFNVECKWVRSVCLHVVKAPTSGIFAEGLCLSLRGGNTFREACWETFKWSHQFKRSWLLTEKSPVAFSSDGSWLRWPHFWPISGTVVLCAALQVCSPLLHYKGNNNNSCTYLSGTWREDDFTKLSSSALPPPSCCTCFPVTGGLSDCCACFILLVVLVNNKKHAVGAAVSAFIERLPLNGLFIFSSVRDAAAGRGDPDPGVLWHFDPSQRAPSPQKLVLITPLRAMCYWGRCAFEGE